VVRPSDIQREIFEDESRGKEKSGDVVCLPCIKHVASDKETTVSKAQVLGYTEDGDVDPWDKDNLFGKRVKEPTMKRMKIVEKERR